MSSHKLLNSFDQRKLESDKMYKKYPDRVIVILEKCANSSLPTTDKSKYLVPRDLSITQFIYIIRKRLTLDQKQHVYIYINNIIPAYHETMDDLDKKYKDNDGNLYIQYSDVNILPSSPIPLDLLVNLALLNFSKSGSKLSYYKGKLHIDSPEWYQGFNRKFIYGSSRDDIVKFDVSLVQCLNIYYNLTNKSIFNYAYDGLGKLRSTYTDDKEMQNVLHNDQLMIRNYMDKYNGNDDKN